MAVHVAWGASDVGGTALETLHGVRREMLLAFYSLCAWTDPGRCESLNTISMRVCKRSIATRLDSLGPHLRPSTGSCDDDNSLRPLFLLRTEPTAAAQAQRCHSRALSTASLPAPSSVQHRQHRPAPNPPAQTLTGCVSPARLTQSMKEKVFKGTPTKQHFRNIH